MARKPRSDLADFQKWLIEVRGLSITTTPSYASQIRFILSALKDEPLSPALLGMWFDGLADRRRARTSRMAWAAFVAYAKERLGMDLPLPNDSALAAAARRYAVPREVITDLRAVVQCNEGLTVKMITLMTWASLERRMIDGAWVLRDPTKPGYIYRAPVNPMKRIELWAQPNSPHDPLVPTHPGSTAPIPEAALRRLIRPRKANPAVD